MPLHKIPINVLFEKNWINSIQTKRNPNIKIGPHEKPGPSQEKADRLHSTKQDKSLKVNEKERHSDEENLSRL